MARLATLVGDIFWSAMMLLVGLIVLFFILRLLGRVPALSGVVGKAQQLATPQG